MIIGIPLPGGLYWADPLLSGKNYAQFTTIGSTISALLPYLFIFGGLGLFAMLIVGGFEVFTALGSEEKAKAGITRMKNAGIGFLALFAIYWLAQIIQILFKIPIL